MRGVVERVDEFQRRHRLAGLPIAVTYKYIDDQGGHLAAVVTYYAFVAIFPLMLIGSSVLGFVLQGNPELQERVLVSAFSQFPIVGSQLGQPEGLQGSASAIVVGATASLYGILGLGQAAQNAVNVAWAVPRNNRFNPFHSRARTLGLLVVAGFTVLALASISSVAANLDSLAGDLGGTVRWLAVVATVALTALVLSVMMRFGTSRRPSLRTSMPGALLVAVGWQLLQLVGGSYVRNVIARASEMNGTFALVLGLVGFLYLACVVAVVGLELNVVLDRHLYPRALLTPFTDAVELTEADQRAYTAYARAQRHKGFQQVNVTFGRGGGADAVPTDEAATELGPPPSS